MEVFNYLTGQSLSEDYRELLVAPFNMKKKFLKLIEREIKNSKKGFPAQIMAKMNQLEDTDIIKKLYKASRAGVEVDLIIRGFCCLRPGLKGVSENIRVISTIGKYLEHSRVFYFANGQKKVEDGLFYMGSADWMHRNLHNRIEVIVPIHEKEHKKRLSKILSILWEDPRSAWELKSSGEYVQRNPLKSFPGSHELLEAFYRKEQS